MCVCLNLVDPNIVLARWHTLFPHHTDGRHYKLKTSNNTTNATHSLTCEYTPRESGVFRVTVCRIRRRRCGGDYSNVTQSLVGVVVYWISTCWGICAIPYGNINHIPTTYTACDNICYLRAYVHSHKSVRQRFWKVDHLSVILEHNICTHDLFIQIWRIFCVALKMLPKNPIVSRLVHRWRIGKERAREYAQASSHSCLSVCMFHYKVKMGRWCRIYGRVDRTVPPIRSISII